MIIAVQKSLEEIRQMLTPYKEILVIGCGTCMTVCNAGGEREIELLCAALRLGESVEEGERRNYKHITLKRQCDTEFIESIADRLIGTDAILSLGCGVGVQALAEYFPNISVMPGVNTSFLGMAEQSGIWDERCRACGDCILNETGGICPITRCTKGILNGPCAGTKKGKCEVNQNTDCAWILIYKRLELLGQLDKIRRYFPPRNYGSRSMPQKIYTDS